MYNLCLKLIDPAEPDAAVDATWLFYSVIAGTRDVTANETYLIGCGLSSAGFRVMEQLL